MAKIKKTKPIKKKPQNAGGRKKRIIKNPSGNSTIFDDVFKTMIEKFPWLLVPLINEVFGTDYGENEIVKLERTEYQTPKERRTMDSYFHIRDKTYHIEC